MMPRTGKEWEDMPPDQRPRFWTTPVPHGVQYRVCQLIFRDNDEAIEYVRKEMPLELDAAMAIWTRASNQASFIAGYRRGISAKLEEFPEYMREGILGYIFNGVPTGDFLRSVFENDLFGAARRADLYNRTRLAEYVEFSKFNMPEESAGSPALVEAWIKKGGLLGEVRK